MCNLGWTGLFCPCVQFGRNIEAMRDDIPWSNGCVCHAICVEGGIALAVATAFINGIDPETSFLIAEGLFFTWWMCGIYTGLFRQSLQKKYHLKVFLFASNSYCDISIFVLYCTCISVFMIFQYLLTTFVSYMFRFGLNLAKSRCGIVILTISSFNIIAMPWFRQTQCQSKHTP